MNKEKLVQLRKRINELFFKKNFQRDKLTEEKVFLENLLRIGLNHLIKILPKT